MEPKILTVMLAIITIALLQGSPVIQSAYGSRLISSAVADTFVAAELVPDILDVAPTQLLSIQFQTGIALLGNELTPTQVKDQPTVSWNADPNKLYLLLMTDPDAPSRSNPTSREWHHWLVGNIPGCDITKGDVLTPYVGSGPSLGTGKHRYTFLIYEQPGWLHFNERRLSTRSEEGRPNFSIRRFSRKYNLGEPIAGNFYFCEYDDYVPILLAQLGI